MKIIDLLNKMANGEEVPKRIRVDNIIYIYENLEHFYYTDDEAREDLLVRGKDWSTFDFLNWNVELIEEDTIDIESIKEIEYYEVNGVGEEQDKFILKETGEYLSEAYNEFEMVVIRKINELVQAVKQLNKEIKSIKEK